MIQLVFDASDAARRSRGRRRGRLQPARRRRAGRAGTTTSSSWWTARIRSSTRPRARTPTSTPAPCSSGRPDRRASAATTRASRPTRVRPSSRRSRATPPRRAPAFPWIAFEGRWGELQPAFFNGPTGPNLKTQWTEPDPLVGGLARPQRRRARRRRARHRRDRLLLRRDRARLACPEPRCSTQPVVVLLAFAVDRRPRGARRVARDVASRRAAAARAPACLGADPGRVGAHVRQPRACCSSASASLFIPISLLVTRSCSPSSSGPRASPASTRRRGRGRPRAARRRARHRLDPARPGLVRPRPPARSCELDARPAGQPRPAPTAWRSAASGRCSARSCSPSSRSPCSRGRSC